MGVEGTCRSANGGGVPLCRLPYIAGLLPCIPSSSSCPCSHRGKFSAIRGKIGRKLDFLWCALVFSRENRRQQRAKFKIYLRFEGCRASGVALSLGRWWCPLGAGGAGSRASGVLRCVFRPFVRSLALLVVRCLQIWLYFAF